VLGAANPIVRSGYSLTYTQKAVDANGCGTAYTVRAVPEKVGETGQRSFYADETGVLRFNTTGAIPTVNDPVLQ
jgi:hypothetical protein